MKYLSLIWTVARRECKILYVNRIYFFSMVVFPLLTMVFFTTLMKDGLPQDMPVGVVDLDNTSTSRSLVQKLDGFQNSQVVAHYPSVAAARHAIQENEIYGFLYIPKGTTDQLLSARRPKVSYYYSQVSISGGSMVMKDLKTITTLGSAGVGMATLSAKGMPPQQIQAFLQPIKIEDRPPSGGQSLGQLQCLSLHRLRARRDDALHVPHLSLLAGHGAEVRTW